MADETETQPYSTGGFVPVRPAWISFPEEVRVLTADELSRIAAEFSGWHAKAYTFPPENVHGDLDPVPDFILDGDEFRRFALDDLKRVRGEVS